MTWMILEDMDASETKNKDGVIRGINLDNVIAYDHSPGQGMVWLYTGIVSGSTGAPHEAIHLTGHDADRVLAYVGKNKV